MYPPKAQLMQKNIRGLTISAKDAKHEAELRQKKLEPHPEMVSTSSGMIPIFGEEPGSTPSHEGNEKNVSGGLASDIRTIRDTFRLADVPREVLYIGMAGLIPYVGTSMSTLYLSWDINFAQENGYGYLISPENSNHLLQLLEPLQIGYGAVIISFLSAIHWGLEFAGYGGRKSFRRYAIGLVGPVVGWSTLLLPLHEALLGQFAAFTALYFFDTSATTAGLAPGWYGTYRFVLTFVVGASILLTLIGRGSIADRMEHVPKPTEKLQKIREHQRQELQKERQQQSEKSSPSKSEKRNDMNDGGVRPGDKNEPTRNEMRSKSKGGPSVQQGPEPSSEKKNNIKPS